MNHNFFLSRLSHFIRGVRQREGLTQRQLAKRLEISESTISRLEAETKLTIKLTDLLSMANDAKLEPHEFMYYLQNSRKFEHKPQVQSWQLELLETLDSANTRSRATFFHRLTHRKADIEEILQVINTVLLLPKKELSTLKKITEVLLSNEDKEDKE